MKEIYSKIKPNKLLHIIHKVDEFYTIEDGHRRDVVGEKEFIQLSALNMKKNHTFKPHQHIYKKGEEEVIAQESWVVIKGSVECHFYDIDGTLLDKPILNVGDCSVTLAGGHTYLILEDDTLVYEYKTGPYKGQKMDKVFL
jgi:cupin fold WbuC family metalloprotein|tara:strand:- start:45 stop:467 length:423 start_codon:yes stop_codon:yes gene_type:complete